MSLKLGSSQTWLFQTWLFAFYAEALFRALLRSFADLRLRSFALICALLRAFACFCVRPRLERQRLGTAENTRIAKGEASKFGEVIHETRLHGGTPELCRHGIAKDISTMSATTVDCAAMASNCSSASGSSWPLFLWPCCGVCSYHTRSPADPHPH